MENSMNSAREGISYGERTSDHESQDLESGWTMYFEDFFNNNNSNNDQEIEDLDYCTHESSSLVSDAASSITKRFTSNDQQDVVGIPIMEQRSYNRSLSFKKRKTKGGLVDDALEDTASSPVSSLKVYSMMNKLENPKEKHSLKNCIQEKGSTTSRNINVHGRDSEVSCTELKKRGLCLVPLSMVLNHLG
ncbi:hypothetical protein HS088_TW21G00530 [Tripterygium wilfordii]|uniref:Uncharacterized protein n=1 Tax=Tripterygium wilfordii TaxID=458696 RepID=A0A7J7C2P1_TRIWF|nr:vascular-related unknown protein 4-like isoform X1 [Tripterygium wilfordii]KAF5728383.1 hypothetical protein HS088_TW21G00530 [Tripterygium wilfordii]